MAGVLAGAQAPPAERGAVKKRRKLTQMLFLIGLALLIVAVAGTVLLASRSYPRRTLEDSIRGEDLMLPTMTPALAPASSP